MSDYFEKRLAVIDAAFEAHTPTPPEPPVEEGDDNEPDADDVPDIFPLPEDFEVKTLTETVESLRTIGAGLQNGKVCKDQAAEINAVHPKILSEVYSMESYTQRPSKTNYTETVEGIASGIGNLLRKAWEAIKQMLDRILRFFFGKDDPVEKVKERSDEIKKEVDSDQKETEKVAKEKNVTLSPVGAGDITSARLKELRKEIEMKDEVISSPTKKQFTPYEEYYVKATPIIESFNELLLDLFFKEDRALTALLDQLDSAISMTSAKVIGAVTDIYQGKSDFSVQEVFAPYKPVFKSASKLTRIPDFTTMKSADEVFGVIHDILEMVGDKEKGRVEFPLTEKDDFRLWLADVNSARWFAQSHNKQEENMEKLSKMVDDAAKRPLEEQGAQNVPEYLRGVIKVLSKSIEVNRLVANAVGSWNEKILSLSKVRIRTIQSITTVMP